MMTTILALLMAAPTASANDDLRRIACEKVGGTWTASGVCEYTSITSELKHLNIDGIEDLGLIQIAIRAEGDEEWVMPMPGEVFVPMADGDFARAPLEIGVLMHQDADYAEAYVEEYGLERTESPVDQLLEELEH